METQRSYLLKVRLTIPGNVQVQQTELLSWFPVHFSLSRLPCYFPLILLGKSNFLLFTILADTFRMGEELKTNGKIMEFSRLINPFNHFARAYFYSGSSCNSAKLDLLVTSPKAQFMLSTLSPRSRVQIILCWHVFHVSTV